jgi:hypothetical protein
MVTRRRWLTPLLFMMAAATLSLAGCTDNEPAASPTPAQGTTYVGQVDASKANIGLVVAGDTLAGFVCESANASLRLDAVPLENGTGELMDDGRVVGTVSVADDVAVGTVEFQGTKHKFQAEPATGDAGVYRRAAENPEEAWDGWIVLNDGSYTGTSKSKPSSGKPWIDPDIDP